MREKIKELIYNNWETVQSDLDSLEPKDRLNFMDKLLSFTLPKLHIVVVERVLEENNKQTVIVFSIPDNGRFVKAESIKENHSQNVPSSIETN